MPIEKMLCLTLLVATQFNGGSAQPRLNRRQLGGVVCTEELCRERFTTMSRAGTLTGYFYSNVDIPTKGCFVKGDSMYYGTGGTDAEMNDSDLGAAKKRVWCNAITLNEERSGNSRICSTEEQCKARYTTMRNAGVILGYFYASSDYAKKGCILKGENFFFGIGGTVAEMTKSELTGQQVRVWCDATSSTTTAQFNDTVTTFYLMSDSPYTANERKNLMPAHIRRLGADAEFLVHLGDLQSARESNCEEWAYQSASNILRKSRVPTFVLPGDNDLNDCEDVQHAEEMWTKYFRRIDERWDHDFEVTRWGDLDKNFSFLHKGVLYFGVNVPGGTPYSSSDAEARYNQHLRRIKSIVGGLSDDDYQVIVLLGHADPSYGDAGNSQAFFERFSGLVS